MRARLLAARRKVMHQIEKNHWRPREALGCRVRSGTAGVTSSIATSVTRMAEWVIVSQQQTAFIARDGYFEFPGYDLGYLRFSCLRKASQYAS